MPSATITKGGDAQLLVAPDAARRGLWVQNNSAADLRLVEGGAAAGAASGMVIKAGAYYETPPTRRALGSWSVWGAADGQSFEWGVW